MKTAEHDEDTEEKAIKHGQGLLAKVRVRKEELERTLALVQAAALEDAAANQRAIALEEALFAIEEKLTGDLDNLSDVTAVSLNAWLERTKDLPVEKLPHAAAHRRAGAHHQN